MKKAIFFFFLLFTVSLSAQKLEYKQLVKIDEKYYAMSSEDVSDQEGLDSLQAIQGFLRLIDQEYDRAARKITEAEILKRRARLATQSLQSVSDTLYNMYLREVDTLLSPHPFSGDYLDGLAYDGALYSAELFTNPAKTLVLRVQMDTLSEAIPVILTGSDKFIRLGTEANNLSLFNAPVELYEDYFLTRTARRFRIYRGYAPDGRPVTLRIRQ